MAVQTKAVLTDKEFLMVSDLVYKHCGINLHDGKKELVQARMAKRMRVGKFNAFSDYITNVLNDPTGGEFTTFIDSLSTNLTSFFREDKHFDYLSNIFLPQSIAAKGKQGNRNLRAWSAGCSSGEEPYTLAITLREAIQASRGWDAKVLATDISTRMLDTGKEGVYPGKRVEPVPPALRKKYFSRVKVSGETHFRVGPALRELVHFRYLNLQEPWPFKGPFDFIFCRNVMIYFDKPTQEKLVGRYWDCLSHGGLLFTGHSESLTGIQHKFQYVEPTIYCKL